MFVAKKRFRPILIPKEVKVSISDSAVRVQGPLGTTEIGIIHKAKLELKENQIFVKNSDETKEAASQQGTMRTLIVTQLTE